MCLTSMKSFWLIVGVLSSVLIKFVTELLVHFVLKALKNLEITLGVSQLETYLLGITYQKII